MKFIKTLLLFCLSSQIFAQIPAGYYDDAIGLEGETLREELFQIIKDHQTQSYTSLWQHFYDTDRKSNGFVWDMYSDQPDGTPDYNFTFFDDQCGNVSSDEGFCYNREHSFPKSWFGDQSPMNSDLFHLYPTDGQVNGRRSNYAFGETDNPSWVSTNGSQRGPSSTPGYTGIVFEPIDAFKGDFARTYFYMITRYKDKVSGWNSPMLSGDGYTSWALIMLVAWHQEDPVSPKEIDRNNAVYTIQNNRNPFIDHPEYVESIWGNPAGIEEYSNLEASVWYAGQTLSVSHSSINQTDVFLYDITGKLIWKKRATSFEWQEDLPLNQGIYLLQLQNAYQTSTTRFFVK